MKHPFSGLPEQTYSVLFKRILPFTLVITAVMIALDTQLKNSEFAPLGILSLQFAQTPEAVQTLFSRWTGTSQVVLHFSLGLDYLYMVTYALAISLGCVLGGIKHPRFQRWAHVLAWLLIVAACLDAIENAACIAAIISGPTELTTAITYRFAGSKFFIIGLGLIFVIWAKLTPAKKQI